jgi:hypothetical protein
MKKYLFLLFVLIITNELKAQSDPFKFGALVGGGMFFINSTQYAANLKADRDNGVLLGVFAHKQIAGRIYIQPEIYYSSRNKNLRNFSSTYDYIVTPADVFHFQTGVINSNFIMGAKILNPSSLFNIRIYTGLTGSIFVGKRFQLNGIEVPKKMIKSGSANIQTGLGFDISRFTMDVRLEFGLTNLSKNEFRMTQSSMLLILGYKIISYK